MPKLLIDPFGDAVTLALADGGNVLQCVMSNAGDKPLALETAYRALGDFATPDEIVLLNGPGNFTSLRVALGFARGLALGFGISSRGMSIFEVDFACSELPLNCSLYRDARGGKYYRADFVAGALKEIVLTDEIREHAYSCEEIEGTIQIDASQEKRMQVLAELASSAKGATPARALYVRPPDAALPSEPPLVILDE